MKAVPMVCIWAWGSSWKCQVCGFRRMWRTLLLCMITPLASTLLQELAFWKASARLTPPRRTHAWVNPIFGVASAPLSMPSLDLWPNTSDSSGGPELPIEMPWLTRDYGDRFVPSRDVCDIHTTYHLMDKGGPSTSSKNRIIPSKSDALKKSNFHAVVMLSQTLTPSFSSRTSQFYLHFHPPHRSHAPVSTPLYSPTCPVLSSTSSLNGLSTVPPSTPTCCWLFTYSSPTSNPTTPTRLLDTPTDEAYSMSHARCTQFSRQLLSKLGWLVQHQQIGHWIGFMCISIDST